MASRAETASLLYKVIVSEHLYGTLVRKSQTPVYGSVMKPIPDQLDIQQDNSNTATNSRKPKGILKNSKQTADGSIGSCSSFTTSTAGGGNSKTPLSPMSDIVVTYSHKENIETLSTSRQNKPSFTIFR